MASMPISITPLNRRDIGEASDVLAAAFADDPVFQHLWAGHPNTLQRLAAYFRTTLTHHHLPGGGVDVAWAPDNSIAAVAIWNPPGTWQTSSLALLREAPQLLLSLRERIPTALTVRREFDRVHPTDAHWYLCNIGTRPDQANRGFATQLLTHRLTACDDRKEPAYLVCTREQTIPLYEKAGFRVTTPLQLRSGPLLWSMWRDAGFLAS
jgi:GNAT superfamily N-acetyltransferase